MEPNWNELLITILPFIIIIAIWLVIKSRLKAYTKTIKTNDEDKHREMVGLLREIRDELKELNKNNSSKP